MNIEKAIENYSKQRPSKAGFTIPTDEYGYWNVNVVFINDYNKDDETQFDIPPANFNYTAGKCKDLDDLWKDFCKENNFKQNSVIAIGIVGGW